MTNRSYAYSRLQNSDGDYITGTKNIAKLKSRGTPNSSSGEDDPDQFISKFRRNKSPKKDNLIELSTQSTSTSSSNNLDFQWDFIEHTVKPGETLQGLAVQYRCNVFELKRINNIVNESEFYAHHLIKIPVVPHSSLKEIASSVPDINVKPQEVRDNLLVTTDFLDQVDQDVKRIKERARVYDIDHTSVEDDINRLRQSARLNKSDCRGDDCGLSWTQLMGLALLILLACPLLYFLYLELEKHRVDHPGSRQNFSNQINQSSAL